MTQLGAVSPCLWPAAHGSPSSPSRPVPSPAGQYVEGSCSCWPQPRLLPALLPVSFCPWAALLRLVGRDSGCLSGGIPEVFARLQQDWEILSRVGTECSWLRAPRTFATSRPRREAQLRAPRLFHCGPYYCSRTHFTAHSLLRLLVFLESV